MKFRVGVIGATGFIGTPYRAHIRGAKEDADIVALCARRRGPLEDAAREDGASFVTADWREIVEHPDVDLVMVVTPDALHHEAVMECAARRKHLICDKPIGANAAEAHEMWSAYRDSGLGHFVPFWTRYLPIFARTKEIVDSGVLGEVRGVVCRWQNPRPEAMPFTWRDDASVSSSGSIGDLGSHAYDTVRWLLGLEAVRVIAHAGVITPPKPDIGEPNLEEALRWGSSHALDDSERLRAGTAFDYGSISVEYAGGAVGYIMPSHSPYIRKGLAADLEIHGTRASLGVERWNGRLVMAEPDEDAELLEEVPDGGPVNQFARFAFPGVRQRAEGSGTDHPGLDDGWKAQLLTDAAALSAERGAWVDLDELDPEA